MLSFVNDYSEGAHESILKRLVETNMEKLPGYGADIYCESAKKKILSACALSNGDVFLLVGGTQTNRIVISSMLSSYQGVIAATSGHISTHEAGAIENSGHKVLEIAHENGKLSAPVVKAFLENFYADENHEHMVFPGMVFISLPTEYGTLYSKGELSELYSVCKDYSIPLYIDGARLGYALASDECDLALPDVADLCDVFYIGGTKVGAFCGEAVVFTKNNAPAHFMTVVKANGALLAKGRLLGIQFDTLFSDDLYLKISRNAIETAKTLRCALKEKGYRFFIDSPTNQLFVILDNKKMRALSESVAFGFWEKFDGDNTVVRFATDWATDPKDVEKLISIL